MNVNDALPVAFAVSRAVTVAVKVPVAVGVPDTTPPLEMVTPGGRPVADQVYGGVPPLAVTWNDAIGVLTVADLLPGLFTATPAGAPNLLNSSRFGEPVP